MTVVNPKSISGINSITTGSGSDDILTIHNNNGPERLRIDSTGTTKITTGIVTTLTATSSAKVGSGVTLSPDGDVFATGVCTATSFSGDGSNLTGISAGTALSGSTDNTVCTVTGANAIQGESNLTFDGSDLTITNSGVSNKGLKLTATGSYYPSIVFDANRSGENQAIVYIRGSWNGTEVGALSVEAGDDTTNKDDGKITFYTAQGGTMTRKMAIEQDGDVHIDTGNIVIGTSGKGIDFSADASSDGSANELLDDYETGTFSPAYAMSGGGSSMTYHDQQGQYVKVGKLVQISMHLRINTVNANGSGNAYISGLPFTPAANSGQGPGYGTMATGYVNGLGGSPSFVHGYIEQGSAYIYLYHGISSGTSQNMTVASHLYNASAIRMSATYQIA